MTKQETITLNGKTYIEYKEGIEVKPAVENDHIIVIAQRGWIFEGLKDKSGTRLYLLTHYGSNIKDK